MPVSQKEAVYQATMAVLDEHRKSFDDGGNIRDVVDGKMRSEIRDLVAKALESGKVGFGRDRGDRDMRTYATGLVSNWFRKDKRLNGGERYQPRTRRDSGGGGHILDRDNPINEQIESLRNAANLIQDSDLKKRLEEQISELEQSQPERDFGDAQGKGRGGDFEEVPSMGSGHRGAVTDPENDMRLKQNQTPERRQALQEAGHKGGTTVARERGSEFFSEIGQKGGQSRGGGNQSGGQEEEEDAGQLFRGLITDMSAARKRKSA